MQFREEEYERVISNCLSSVVTGDSRNSAFVGLVLRRALLCYIVLQDGNPIVIATHRFKGTEALCGCFGVNLSIKYFHFPQVLPKQKLYRSYISSTRGGTSQPRPKILQAFLVLYSQVNKLSQTQAKP